MITLRDLPGAQSLETAYLLYPSHVCSDRARAWIEHTFGIRRFDLDFPEPEWSVGLKWDEMSGAQHDRYCAAYDEWEKPYLILSTDDEETATALAERGWDVRDEFGRPMKCLQHVARAIAASIAGVAGKKPEAIIAESWAAKLGPRKPSEGEVRCNKSFLEFGRRRKPTHGETTPPGRVVSVSKSGRVKTTIIKVAGVRKSS